MFKRFHDRDKWRKPWYRELSPVEKCAWDYITSECDNVGVWIPDYEMAEYCIYGKPIHDEHINWEEFRSKCNGNIVLMECGKWWIVDFCIFQYPLLLETTTSKPLLSYIALLKKHNLWEGYKNNYIGLGKGMHSVQDKDKDKDKDKEEANGLDDIVERCRRGTK
jgi:hypothetical protein